MRRNGSARYVAGPSPAGPRALVLFIFAWVLLLAVAGRAEPRPEIHLHVFLSSTCPHCEVIQRPALRKLSERLQCAIRPHYHDVDSLAEYRRLVLLEERMGDTGNDLPVVFAGGRVLGGTEEIEADLEDLLRQHRESGLPAVELPGLEEADSRVGGAVGDEQATVYLAYFGSPGCRECDRVERMLEVLAEGYGALEVRRFLGESRREQALLEVLCERAEVSPERRLVEPALFVGSRALVREQIDDAALRRLLEDPPPGAGRPPWQVEEQQLAAARRRLAHRAGDVALAAVIGGGLVDGVNPCAFATIAFLVVCLSGMGAARGRILSVGVGFTTGVFVAYFLAGVALAEALRQIDLLPWLSRALTWGIIGALMVLAVLSFRDAARAASGQLEEMSLKLPAWLRRRINAVIARRLRARWLFGGALALGMSVSVLEFVCTGQVYVPLIRYMTATTETRLRGLALLAVYDVAFVLPLVVVFGAAYVGLRSESLMAAFRRHVGAGKVLLGIFFLALGGLLVHAELVGF